MLFFSFLRTHNNTFPVHFSSVALYVYISIHVCICLYIFYSYMFIHVKHIKSVGNGI